MKSATEPSAPHSSPPAGLRVRLFAGLRESAGWGERSLTWEQAGIAAPGLDADATPVSPRSLWCRLQLGSAELPTNLRVAVNHGFCSPDQPLQAGDEVAFLPPISGG